MIGSSRSPHWYLFDYAAVISTAPTAADWDFLEEETAALLRHPASAYWALRGAFEAGFLSSADYWSRVTGRSVAPARAAWFDALDAGQWSHYNLETLDVLDELADSGARLALLSNMPAAMVSNFSGAPWLRYFERLFFSSNLGLVKPSQEIFRHVLAALDAPPEAVTFIDGSPVSVEAARSLGLDARLLGPTTDLSRELKRLSV